jgi:predicted site-specific integrase-resolvase
MDFKNMKTDRVLKLLKVSRQTLCKYVKNKKIKVTKLVNGYYDYDDESVYKLLNQDLERTSVIYCRVSTNKQKKDLENQKDTLIQFCNKNNIKISKSYCDIASGISLNRPEFKKLLFDVINHKINKVFITYKDRLSRLSFDLINELFKEFNCEIVILNNIDDNKTIEKELFSEIISIIHVFSMKLYSQRRKEKLKLIEKDLKLEENI